MFFVLYRVNIELVATELALSKCNIQHTCFLEIKIHCKTIMILVKQMVTTAHARDSISVSFNCRNIKIGKAS